MNNCKSVLHPIAYRILRDKFQRNPKYQFSIGVLTAYFFKAYFNLNLSKSLRKFYNSSDNKITIIFKVIAGINKKDKGF